ncbi:hypothetical protein [Bacillus sp. REN3]|uniref:hypothetical protein n=1 Tax=Bacillus sp. REN3 TaxID=2802440 RepID=UPI001AEDE23A|nr:hypothetical protein [Bacillus sp. REN3]
MNGFTDERFYDLVYKGERYSYLQFVRKDFICDVCYVTFKNVITGEMLTFDQTEVLGFRASGDELNAS